MHTRPELILQYAATVRAIPDHEERIHALDRTTAYLAGRGTAEDDIETQIGRTLAWMERFDERTVRVCLGYAREAAGDAAGALPPASRPMLLESSFDGHPITTLEFQGRPVWIAREIGSALGYDNDGHRFVKNLTSRWAMEIADDAIAIEGTELQALKDLARDWQAGQRLGSTSAPSCRTIIGGRARSLILLTETGFHLACLLTRKPAGRKLRRWLATEILPRLARGQGVPAQTQPREPEPGDVSRERFLQIMAGIVAPQVIEAVSGKIARALMP